MVCCCNSSQMDLYRAKQDQMSPKPLLQVTRWSGMRERYTRLYRGRTTKRLHRGSNQAGLFMGSVCLAHIETMRGRNSSRGCRLYNTGIFSLTPLKRVETEREEGQGVSSGVCGDMEGPEKETNDIILLLRKKQHIELLLLLKFVSLWLHSYKYVFIWKL